MPFIWDDNILLFEGTERVLVKALIARVVNRVPKRVLILISAPTVSSCVPPNADRSSYLVRAVALNPKSPKPKSLSRLLCSSVDPLKKRKRMAGGWGGGGCLEDAFPNPEIESPRGTS